MNDKKYIDLSELPRLKGKTNKIDWSKSNGYSLNGFYNDITFNFIIVDYQRKGQKLTINYNGKECAITTCHLINIELGIILGIKTTDFKFEIGTILQDENRDITINDRKYVDNPYNKGKFLKYYKYKCNKCGFDCGEHWSLKDKEYKKELWILESNLSNQKNGCSCCHNVIVVENINSIYKTDKWMIPIINNLDFCKTHTHSTKEKIFPTCIDCNIENSNPISVNNIYNHHGFSCHKCGDGINYPNKFAFNILKQLQIEFQTEYNPKWCKYTYKNKLKKGYYDFYIPSMNLIIEMDGGFHYRDNLMNGQTAKESKTIDNYKDKLANENGIEVIRINCDYPNMQSRFEYIKQNILNSKLYRLFDLNKIDWFECDLFSNSNLVKIACELKKNVLDINIKNISEIMKYKNTTINKWIKEGHKLGWC